LDLLSPTGGSPTPMTFSLSTPDGGLKWVLSFTASNYIGSSLPDGMYSLIISSSGVTSVQNGLVMTGANQTFSFWRLYGDFTGEGDVNGTDYTMLVTNFAQELSPSLWYLSYIGQDVITGSDFTAFVTRFGKELSMDPMSQATVLAKTFTDLAIKK
jgi:hypothetical protein